MALRKTLRKRLAMGLLLAALGAPAGAEERMNGMVGVFYHSENRFAFEYDLIAQFWKSKDWYGNFTGPMLMEEVSYRSNKVGVGFAAGKRWPEMGTYGLTASVFTENRWDSFSEFRPGAEAKLSALLLGVKAGVMDWNWNDWYFAVGISY